MSTQTPVGADWYDDLRTWLEPFLAALGRSEQRSGRRCTCGDCWGPALARASSRWPSVCPGQTQQLHHFVATSPWACEPLERVLRRMADSVVSLDISQWRAAVSVS